MALRLERGARLRRAARGRPGFVALAVALYLGAGLVAAGPTLRDAGSSFLAGGADGHGEAAPGDHLQTVYHLWLVGHQLEHGRAPWRDPYSFRPEAAPTPNLQGWPLGLAFWPLDALLGAVRAWNVLQLLSYVAAGGLACAWLRALGLPRGAALAGGLAFALAPYRAVQGAGHALGLIAILLPLALLGLERGRRGSAGWLVLAAAALASIPLSGQVHLALGAIPFACAYGLARARDRRMVVAVACAAVAGIAAGVVVQRTTIAHSHLAGGRSLDAVHRYQAGWLDFLRRDRDDRGERFVYLGWLAPALATVGLLLLLRARRHALATVLALGVAVPILLAVGTRTPLYSAVWHVLPPFRYPRVPERLLPIACLALAALVAFAVARIPRVAAVSAVAIVLLALDLHVRVYRASAADESNAAYASLREFPPGRVLDLPVFLPDIHYGSVYEYYELQAPREQPFGYSTTAPRSAMRLGRKLRPLGCGRFTPERLQLLRKLGVRYIVVHAGLYRENRYVRPRCAGRTVAALERNGFVRVAQRGPVALYAPATSP